MAGDPALRPFRSGEDYAHLAGIWMASEGADGRPMTVSAQEIAGRLAQDPRFDLARDLVIAEVEGQAAGYGRVRWWENESRRTYGQTGFVRPERRRQGIGRALLAWTERRAREIAGERPTLLPGCLQLNAAQFQPGLHALARQAGYGVKESWALMVRPSLEDIPDAPLPAGLEVRPARPEHFPAIWYAVEEAYVPEGGPPPTGVMPEDFRRDPNFQPELWQVAWDVATGKVAGSVLTYIHQAENRQLGLQRGYTEGISTVPGWRRRGAARALIALSLIAQRTAGMTESALVCSGENLGNYRLYESCGFREVKRDTVYEKPV